MATVTRTPFELRGADGGPLRGDVRTAERGDARPAVVICHGFKGFKDWGFFPHLAERLARAGVTAVSFNVTGSGVGPDGETFSEPERFGHNTLSRELEDLTTVWRALAAGDLVPGLVPPVRTGLFGHSRGGGIAVLFAGSGPNPPVAVLVTWAAIAQAPVWPPDTVREWRRRGMTEIVNTRTGDVLPLYTDVLDDLEANAGNLDIARSAGRVATPWLIVHGDQDETVPADHATRLARAARPGIAEVKIVGRGSHTFGARHPWAGTTTELETALDATAEWLLRQLM